MTGNLFIVCAPSGTGKTSLVTALLNSDQRMKLSISYTTRPPRGSESDGRQYHFVSLPIFKQMLEHDEFLESAVVHGNHYGTPRAWINEQRALDNDILMEIDWQGAAQVRQLIKDAISIFILPPSREALLARLMKRGEDQPEVIARRLAAARTEIAHAGEFDYVIINDDFDQAMLDLKSIIRAQRLRSASQLARHSELIERLNRSSNGSHHR
jgi:guanylate kinase